MGKAAATAKKAPKKIRAKAEDEAEDEVTEDEFDAWEAEGGYLVPRLMKTAEGMPGGDVSVYQRRPGGKKGLAIVGYLPLDAIRQLEHNIATVLRKSGDCVIALTDANGKWVKGGRGTIFVDPSLVPVVVSARHPLRRLMKTGEGMPGRRRQRLPATARRKEGACHRWLPPARRYPTA